MTRNGCTTHLAGVIGMDVMSSPIQSLNMEIQRVSKRKARKLMAFCLQALDSRKLRARHRETDRIAVVKCLVGLLPDTEHRVRWLLSRPEADGWTEEQFTLFCYIEEAQEIEGVASLMEDVPRLVGTFLATVRTDRSRAGWMAAHLLGEHWPTIDAARILCDVAAKGRFAMGRWCSLSGIESLAKVTQPGPVVDIIRETVQRVVAGDRSGRVRRYARKIHSSLV